MRKRKKAPTPYHLAVRDVARRYQAIETGDPELERFMEETVASCDAALPICKLNRWLGYIQGALITRGILSVREERDATRPIFRPLDYPGGEPRPGARIWYVSDTHFCHGRIIVLAKRPFGSVEEMDEAMIANWNDVVAEGDIVYFNGDFATFGRGAETIREIFSRLKGVKHLVIGNHDEENETTLSLPWASIQHQVLVRDGTESVFLAHYAHVTWPGIRKGSRHLYGHTHGQLKGTRQSLDISVDATGFKPISLTQAIAKMRHLPDWPTRPEEWRS